MKCSASRSWGRTRRPPPIEVRRRFHAHAHVDHLADYRYAGHRAPTSLPSNVDRASVVSLDHTRSDRYAARRRSQSRMAAVRGNIATEWRRRQRDQRRLGPGCAAGSDGANRSSSGRMGFWRGTGDPVRGWRHLFNGRSRRPIALSRSPHPCLRTGCRHIAFPALPTNELHSLLGRCAQTIGRRRGALGLRCDLAAQVESPVRMDRRRAGG